MEQYRIFEIIYLGPTNKRGSRIKIKTKQESKTIDRDHSFNSTTDQAISYLKSKGINIIGRCSTVKQDFLLSQDWEKENKFLTIK